VLVLALAAVAGLGWTEEPPELTTLVSEAISTGDFSHVQEIAVEIVHRVEELSGEHSFPSPKELRRSTKAPTSGDKLQGQLIVTDQAIDPLRVENCIIFTTAPVRTQAYISGSLIVSAAEVRTSSYLIGSVVVTPALVKVGSYATGNVIDAGSVRVGSRSRDNWYLNVEPFVGKDRAGDKSDRASLREMFRF
jgi:hypothetical protein